MDIPKALQLAVQLHKAGRLTEADNLYAQVLEREPKNADALHLRGTLAGRMGDVDRAIELLQRALAVNPRAADFHFHLGIALKMAGKLDEAVESYRRAIELNPAHAQAHCNLGVALKAGGKIEAAVDAYRAGLETCPDFSEMQNNLAAALVDLGQFEEAIALYHRVLQGRPNDAVIYLNLANAYRDEGNIHEAFKACRRSLELKPNHPPALHTFGLILVDNAQYDEAIIAVKEAIRLQPDFVRAYITLAGALGLKRQPDEAIAAIENALRLEPNSAIAVATLALLHKDRGELEKSVSLNRQALQLQPDDARAHANLLYTIQFDPRFDAASILKEHRDWADRHARMREKFIHPHPNDPHPDRRLRIGYVSPDFRDHCQNLFTIPLLKNHDHNTFEIFCYSKVRHPDLYTEQLKTHADHWRDIVFLSEEKLVQQIREDRVDILVDLTMHMSHSCLLAFARKPAPVQVTWLAYPGTTGLSTIDYRLTDPYLDPPGTSDEFYAEKSIRLPDTFWCYDPLAPLPEVNEPPVLTTGHITFGCLNNFCKINDRVLDLWAQAMRAVEKSRLLIMAPPGETWDELLSRFAKRDISADRIERVPHQRRPDYLATYHRIDIGLDTFPYNGHTTSLDSYWMGVPVITLPGSTVVGRAGISQLTNLQLTEFIAKDRDDFSRITAELAADLPRLTHLRSTLRSRLQSSPLMNAPRFTKNLEAAYRQIWREWCNQQKNQKTDAHTPLTTA